MHELSDEEILQLRTPAPSSLTTGNMGRALAAIAGLQAFQKRADSLLAKIGDLTKRVAELEAEKPQKPKIYREAR